MPRTATAQRVTPAPAGSAAKGGRTSKAAAPKAAPDESGPAQGTPGMAVPVRAATVNVVPVKAARGRPAKVEAVRVKAAPLEAVRVKPVRVKAVAVKAVPVEAVPVKAVPVRAVAVEALPVRDVPVKAVAGTTTARANTSTPKQVAAEAARAQRAPAPVTAAPIGTEVPPADQVLVLAVAAPAPAPAPHEGVEPLVQRRVVVAARPSRRRGRFQRPVVPVALGSLTQPGARSGDSCAVCGSARVTGLALLLTDGTPVRFTSCHACEHRSWVGPDGEMDREAVLERTRKLR